MEKLLRSLPQKSEFNRILSSLSKKEWVFFVVLFLVLAVSTLSMLGRINGHFLVNTPVRGGEISEGIIGTPRFVNPVLAFTDVDRDLTALVYSGLLRKSPDGTLIPDLAQKYEASPDGLSYTFVIRDNAYFHDGEKVTVEDVLFTIEKVKDGIIKSPRKAAWDGISVEKLDDQTIEFTLRQAYIGFLENATLGIVPAHIWSNSAIELNTANTNPVGSGPYKVDNVSRESSGAIRSYELEPFNKFALGKPYLQKITLRFYQNEDDLVAALLEGEVGEVSSISPESAQQLKNKNYRLEGATLPRIFALFFNQNQKQIFTNKAVLSAVNQAIDKDRIVREVLLGYGEVIDSPIPKNMLNTPPSSEIETLSREEILEKAASLLDKDGWKKNDEGWLEKTVTNKGKKTVTPLEFSISTGNLAELARTAELIKEDLAPLGIRVEVKTFDVGNLNQSVIRPRKYDALLFGQIVNTESDLFAFWHSSQRKDPGLNVAMYTNARADKILEDASVSVDNEARVKKYQDFENEIKKDQAAVFLYSPNFIYVAKEGLQGLSLENLVSPSDRFLNVYNWYLDKAQVWKIFKN